MPCSLLTRHSPQAVAIPAAVDLPASGRVFHRPYTEALPLQQRLRASRMATRPRAVSSSCSEEGGLAGALEPPRGSRKALEGA